MPHRPLDADGMREALRSLDDLLDRPARLVIGGGAAMVLAYDFTFAMQGVVDAFATRGGLDLATLDAKAQQVAQRLDIEPDWLNGHFLTFTGVLPPDYATRLRVVYDGQHLRVDALGPEDLLVMKCFAGRDKDRSHARVLLRRATDLDLVDRHFNDLVERGYPGAEAAADYFDDLRDLEER
jgi:hypothetical protein